ncbi:trigger factor [Eubacterium pyruvativorans]|uniref:Trigger factor n=1 Tax=Eubacterium pyruvativorans TaxID=155865 RepID=A0A1I7H4E0_9FIRM|nr:trigger factor [Eubacterium pyruvativorans]MDO5568091.1 trigger factor [Eubacteriales bacterium]HAT82015.1 trigger factor [Eubacterium sp.]MDD6707365.1 trigger factor [Eubacterium pyruvativorans]SDF14309.1 trigger factor [Eubacterium pyruvativorans]SFO21636.1 trigger factor [Eubacterium pyruvativorans]
MNTTIISNENNEAKFTIEYTAEEFDKAVNAAYQKNKGRFQINGFRKGKAPRKIIESHYGEGIFFEDAINDLFGQGYPKAVDELDLEVIDQPEVDFSEVGHGKPLTMTMTVALYPTVEVKDYNGLDIEQVQYTITDEDVEKEIENLQKRNARTVSVERPVQNGDTVVLDYAGFVGEDQFEGGTAENQELKIGSGMFIPGFEDQLVGAEKDAKVDVNVTFPENYQAKELAGKDATFHCTIHEIKEEQLPELNDEFAQDVSEFDTLDELKEDTKKNLQRSLDDQSVEDAKTKLIDALREKNEIEVPHAMVEDELNNMMNEFDQQLRYQGMSLDLYLQYTGGSMDDFRSQAKEDAEKRVASRIIIRSIADKEGIGVTEDELNEELQKVADQYKMSLEDFRKAIGKDAERMFRTDIQVRKTIDQLFENANVTKVDPPAPKAEEETADEAEKTEE